MLTIALAGAALELALGVCAVIIVKSAAASRIIYGAIIVVTTLSLAAALTHLLSAAPAENLTLSACPGSARISASTRSPRSSSPWSISVPRAQVCSRSAMATTSRRRDASCRSILPFSRA